MSVAAIQQATLAARKRTGDNSIAVRVRQGRAQVVGIDYSAKGTCDRVREISPWVAIADAPAELDRVCAS
jgi:hypothetical protein